MTFIYALIAIGLLWFAFQALRSKSLLLSALWLAGASGLVSLLMYMLGAPGLAVIELSVGAGLVTVLFVFVISITGDEQLPAEKIFPPWLGWVMVILAFGTVAFLWNSTAVLPTSFKPAAILADTIWVNRQIDLYLQAALIITGILGMMILIAPSVANRRKGAK